MTHALHLTIEANTDFDVRVALRKIADLVRASTNATIVIASIVEEEIFDGEKPKKQG